VDVEELIDRLYSLPLEEFTRERNDAERKLRKAGEPEQADRVKGLRKPTAAAGAVNRLVRDHRAQVEAFLEAAARLRDAQVAGKGNLAAAVQAERVALDELVAVGGESVRATLEAAAVDDEIASDLLVARLVREPEPAGFGTLLAHAEPAMARSAGRTKSGNRRTPASAKPDDRAARARLQEAKNARDAAAAEERQARRRWTQTQQELEKAQAAVDKAQRELDRVHGR
jgi:hypothetical protein